MRRLVHIGCRVRLRGSQLVTLSPLDLVRRLKEDILNVGKLGGIDGHNKNFVVGHTTMKAPDPV